MLASTSICVVTSSAVVGSSKTIRSGSGHHCHGDHGALKLATRHLVREALAEPVRLGEAQKPIQRHRLRGRGRGRHQAVGARAFDRLLQQAMRRIEGGGRALCDVGDARAANSTTSTRVDSEKVDAVEGDRAAGQAAAGAHHPKRGKADGRLAGARLADDAEDLPAPQFEINAAHDRKRSDTDPAFDRKIAHGE